MVFLGLSGITLTGVDPACDFQRLVSLSDRYPLAEWGVLYSPKRAGKEGRYPTLDQARDLLGRMGEANVRCALHLCGGAVGDALAGEATLDGLMGPAGRVQLNFNHARAPLDLKAVDALAERLGRPVITQHHAGNTGVWQALASPFHQVLFDASGGTGACPETWPQALPGKLCGWAGGLGPGRVAGALPGIAHAAAGQPFWIDMETRLRDAQDGFDLDCCEQVLGEAWAWCHP